MKKRGVICDPFDIVVVDFPFTDLSVVKRRPAVVLTRHIEFGQSSGSTIAAMISAPLLSSWPLDFPISDPVIAGLNKPSLVRMKLMTIDLRRVHAKIGTLGAADQASLTHVIKQLFPYL